ncbi:MAG TPA: adenylosuccinate synthase [Candidatus Omnitrophota bacterium]|nr:adenylosuccinate synthase [Candidatus Omnitrophota bacterium]
MNTILIGAQWGDEGKGKIIDVLTEKCDYVVRYQGGANAGHTVQFGDQEFVLHLVPSGVLHAGKRCVIGNGVVIDPEALFGEIDALKKRGVRVDGRLFISEQAHLIMPYHKLIDSFQEESRHGRKIGTTKRGIGPCYADKIARLGIRVGDLMDLRIFEDRLRYVLSEKNRVLTRIYGRPALAFGKVYKDFCAWRRRMKPFVVDTIVFLNEAVRQKKKILFEGAQGTLLDVDHGTYPYVTSSNATAGGAITGTGVAPTHIGEIVGVVKAYTTRVGEGPFPTEFGPELMEKIRTKGEEFGATTGRPRRCGWFDAVVVRHAVCVNGLNSIAVTKLDVLDELPVIKIATAYRCGGKIYDHLPSNVRVLEKCRPVYEDHPGWQEDITGVKRYRDLPSNAKKYLARLSRILKTPISIISVGAERTQTIFVR